jgi:hypothetical protein
VISATFLRPTTHPHTTGIHSFVWVVLAVITVIAAALFARRLYGTQTAALPPTPPPDPPLSPWRAKVRDALRAWTEKDEEEFWNTSNRSRNDLVAALFAEAVARLGTGEITPDPDDECSLTLRGVWNGATFCIVLEGETFERFAMDCEPRVVDFTLHHDPRDVPRRKTEASDADPRLDRRRYFGRGIFVEGEGRAVEEVAAAWESIPEAVRAAVLEQLPRLNLDGVRLDDGCVALGGSPWVNELEDPAAFMVAGVHLLELLKQGVEHPTALPRKTCTGCDTNFSPSEESPACPKCGAA